MNIVEIPAKPKEQKKLRVAAYARVSAEMEMKLHSLTAQEDYYREYVSVHPGWELVSVYSDYGISGTTIQRPSFQRMLEDCRAGKIDLVVTKSVTRFARNTVILLETIRELKALGIDCYFEKEDMHSISPDGELLLTLLAMYAEEEARSASENQRWRILKMFEQGRANIGYMLGYRQQNGKFVIVPEEAEIVRQIFTDYLSGMGMQAIARKLMRQGVPTYRGLAWRRNTIRRILCNEKYTGNMLLQKTYRPDFKSPYGIPNRGERRKYYVENSHEPIIDQETFDAVQQEMFKRSNQHSPATKLTADHEENLFKRLIICGICHSRYIRKRQRSSNKIVPVWICNTYACCGKDVCPSQKIPESILIEKAKDILKADTLTRQVLEEKLDRIIVPEHNRLTYIFKDGNSVDVLWKHPSRSLSWTQEMRQAAREKTLQRYRKEK